MYADAVLSVFSQRYADARDKFISAVETSSIVERVNNIIHPVRGPKNERLFCDIAWAGSPKAKNILVLVSGVHGVEGGVGGTPPTVTRRCLCCYGTCVKSMGICLCQPE